LGGYDKGEKVLYFNGQNWQNISGDIPNVPINTIVLKSGGDDELYIGSDIGVFRRDSVKKEWEIFGSGLPNVIVNEQEIHYPTGKLRAATYGRGIWETQLYECKKPIKPVILISGDTSLCSGMSVNLSVADTSGYAYSWSDGSEGKQINVTRSGIYFVSAINAAGCMEVSDPIVISVHPPLILDYYVENKDFNGVASSFDICNGDTIKLSFHTKALDYIENPKYNKLKYFWNTGNNTASVIITDSGTYKLTVITPQSCTVSGYPFTVRLLPAPEKPSVQYSNGILSSSAADEYQWFSGSELIKGAANQNYKPEKNGSYRVEVFNVVGCGAFSDFIDVTDLAVKDNIQETQFSISPNPNKGLFRIIGSGIESGFVTVKIIDEVGVRIIDSSIFSENGMIKLDFDLSKYSAGIYFVIISLDECIYNYKIVKE
ncbi:MAG: hypothetical protein QG635_1664, partial [Bacteroidota bacterium]|nr:hypothetical protein [Bacteroidota bacterium]